MRISLFRDTGNIDQLITDVQAAERYGFHGVWFGQIFGGDTLTAIALVGAQTERIELGSGVIPTHLHHPFSLAQQALTVGAAMVTIDDITAMRLGAKSSTSSGTRFKRGAARR